MEKWTESLEQYLEEGKLPLVGEIFSRKKEIGDKLIMNCPMAVVCR